MVIYDGVKFACLSCIRGHRSSNCNHTDRPLLEVRKKGRPISQCAYCRDLRKTKQIHTKCICKPNNLSANCQEGSSTPCTCTEKTKVVLVPCHQKPKTMENVCSLHAAAAVSNGNNSDSNRPQQQKEEPAPPSTVADLGLDSLQLLDNTLEYDANNMTTTTAAVGNLIGGSCGSLTPHPTCATNSLQNFQGESVLVTITPLQTSCVMNAQTVSKIMTCYCGFGCACPGCLVHPKGFTATTFSYSSSEDEAK